MSLDNPTRHNGLRVVYGRDHTEHGSIAVESLGTELAVAVSAGAFEKARPPLDPNEDVCAIAQGAGARLLVVADAHDGREAAEIAVEHVLNAVGGDVARLNLPDRNVTAILFEAGVAVQRGVGLPDAPHPQSRTTLAVARVAPGFVEWVSFGDSCVIVASPHVGRRLDKPRPAYLGYWFSHPEVGALATAGLQPLARDEVVVLASDGFAHFVSTDGGSPEQVVSAVLNESRGATDVARALVETALVLGASDAVSVAVARSLEA